MRVSRHFKRIVCFCVALSIANWTSSFARGEEVDNPQYLSWAKFKPGSTRTLAGEMAGQGGMSVQMEMTSTLDDVKPDEATIETSVSVNVMGQQQKRPPQKRPVLAKIEKHDITEIGQENVEVMGKTYTCKIYEAQGESPMGPRRRPAADGGNAPATQPGQAKVKLWVSGEVPGGLVKMNVMTPGGEMTLKLKSFEAK